MLIQGRVSKVLKSGQNLDVQLMSILADSLKERHLGILECTCTYSSYFRHRDQNHSFYPLFGTRCTSGKPQAKYMKAQFVRKAFTSLQDQPLLKGVYLNSSLISML